MIKFYQSKWKKKTYNKVSDKSKNCLSVGNSGILDIVVCHRLLLSVYCKFFTYTSLYSLSIYLCLKRYHKNERHLYLLAHIFTKLSQIVSLINTLSLIYWHIICTWKLWNVHWYYCVFFGIFTYNWRSFMFEVLYIHQTFTNCEFD